VTPVSYCSLINKDTNTVDQCIAIAGLLLKSAG
jgi:hypothetical protein